MGFILQKFNIFCVVQMYQYFFRYFLGFLSCFVRGPPPPSKVRKQPFPCLALQLQPEIQPRKRWIWAACDLCCSLWQRGEGWRRVRWCLGVLALLTEELGDGGTICEGRKSTGNGFGGEIMISRLAMLRSLVMDIKVWRLEKSDSSWRFLSQGCMDWWRMGGRGGGVPHGPEETTGQKTEPSLMTFAS